jgi:hypothetical protein
MNGEAFQAGDGCQKGGVIAGLESADSLIPFASSVAGRSASLLRPHFPPKPHLSSRIC